MLRFTIKHLTTTTKTLYTCIYANFAHLAEESLRLGKLRQKLISSHNFIRFTFTAPESPRKRQQNVQKLWKSEWRKVIFPFRLQKISVVLWAPFLHFLRLKSRLNGQMLLALLIFKSSVKGIKRNKRRQIRIFRYALSYWRSTNFTREWLWNTS